MTETRIKFDNRPPEAGGPETDKLAAEASPLAAEIIVVPPDDVVRLAKAGLERAASLNPIVDPSAHLSTDNWYGHKRIKPTSRQLHGPGH